MAQERDRSGGRGRPTSPPPLWPWLLGFALGTILVAGYVYWSHRTAQTADETAVDTDFAKPAPADCAIVQAVAGAIHASGDDGRWRAQLGPLTLKARSQMINPVDVPGFTDEEADNLRGKTAADWRGCAGLDAFVRGLGWAPMSGDEDIAEIGLSLPGVSAAGDEAKVYEMVGAPQGASGALMRVRGPWLVTLRRDGATWTVTGRANLPR